MDTTTLIIAIAIIATTISVITQVTKELPGFNKIPTALEVVILSLILTPTAVFAYSAYNRLPLTWYMIVAAFIAAFFVAFISMFGWDKLSDIYKKFRK